MTDVTISRKKSYRGQIEEFIEKIVTSVTPVTPLHKTIEGAVKVSTFPTVSPSVQSFRIGPFRLLLRSTLLMSTPDASPTVGLIVELKRVGLY